MSISEVNKKIWDSDGICKKCRYTRIEIFGTEIEEKEKKYNNCFCPVCPGFFNVPKGYKENELRGKAIFFVLESMGGGREWKSKEETTLDGWMGHLQKYYINIKERLVNFHQYCIREILKEFDNCPYVVTDVVKCFVWKGKGKNLEMAADFCSENFLKEQVFCAKPKVIVLFGGLAKRAILKFVGDSYRRGIKNLRSENHGEAKTVELIDEERDERMITTIVYSVFPTANKNADRWIKYGSKEKILEAIRRAIL